MEPPIIGHIGTEHFGEIVPCLEVKCIATAEVGMLKSVLYTEVPFIPSAFTHCAGTICFLPLQNPSPKCTLHGPIPQPTHHHRGWNVHVCQRSTRTRKLLQTWTSENCFFAGGSLFRPLIMFPPIHTTASSGHRGGDQVPESHVQSGTRRRSKWNWKHTLNYTRVFPNPYLSTLAAILHMHCCV